MVVLFLAGTYFTFLAWRAGAGSQPHSAVPHVLGFAMVPRGQGDAPWGWGGNQGWGTWGMSWAGWGKGKAGLEPEAWPECWGGVWSVLHLSPAAPEPQPCPCSPTPRGGCHRHPKTQQLWTSDPQSVDPQPEKGGSGVWQPRAAGQGESRDAAGELLLPNELLLFSAAADKSN